MRPTKGERMTPERRREVFERVRDHLLRQMGTSYMHGTCAYRGEEGLSCAVGCLILDWQGALDEMDRYLVAKNIIAGKEVRG
jgi:hypothetical protein